MRKELLASYPYLDESESLRDGLLHCVKDEGRKIIFIIDEWDAPIRETSDPEIHSAYLNLLRNWFKNNNFTPQVVAGAYMTGILPIKKDGTQSAVSDFMEYPILYPGGFAPFTGLTESEVLALCAQYGCDFQGAKDWYDGYHFPDCESIYNPYSVMQAMHNRKYRSYWQKTSAAESLMSYIELDFDGLQDIVARLLTDEEIEVNVNSFGNDFVSFQSRDDVLTLLIHLGYLTYNEEDRTVRIPNREVRMEFENILKAKVNNANWVRLIARSRQLLKDVIEENEAGFSSSGSCR